jgi:hypothetical protein
VQDVDERFEVVRCAEAAGRREITDRLVAPRAIEWMLADGQQLDVRVAHLRAIRDELFGQVAVAEELAGCS